MDHITRSDRIFEILNRGVRKEWTIIHHFFDFRGGNSIRNNFEGFLRSLLYQLVEKIQVGEHLARDAPLHDWSCRELREELEFVLKKAARLLCIFLDGLDEYAGEKVELIPFLRKLGSGSVKICLASRPEPLLYESFKTYPGFRMEELNYEAIDKFVWSTLQEATPDLIANPSQELEDIIGEIPQRANGVFLWARFATFGLATGLASRKTHAELKEGLDDIPKDLEDIYSRIFKRLTPPQRRKAGYMFQIVCYAKRTLRLGELMAAMAYASTDRPVLMHQMTFELLESFRVQISDITGGLLEVGTWKPSESMEQMFFSCVGLLHKTVQGYLERRGWSEILLSKQDTFQPELLWLNICAKQFTTLGNTPQQATICEDGYLSLDLETITMPPFLPNFAPYFNIEEDIEFPKLVATKNSAYSPISDSPLWPYVFLFIMDHAKELEECSRISSYPWLKPLMSRRFVRLHDICVRQHEAYYGPCACFLKDYHRRPCNIRCTSLWLMGYNFT